jgi:hypothetical protein
MNTFMSHAYSPCSKTLLGLATAWSLLAAMPSVRAQTIPGIYDPGSNILGQTYGQWSATWWQWAMSLPVTSPVPHPFFDDPAFDVTEGQSNSVWFLGAPFGAVQRTCSIPEGKLLFVGLLNAEDSGLEDPGSTAEEQLASAESQADLIQNVSFTLDGVTLTNIGGYRVQSPQFSFTAPTPWIFGDTGGTSTSVGDGYFVMLAPLAPGTHTIHYSGTIPAYGLTLDMTYHLTVVPTNGIFAATATLYGKTSAEYSASWWQWVFSLPTTNNPILDTAPISTGQNGKVWYLCGNFSGNPEVRSGNVPEGTSLFFPIINAEVDNTDCPAPDTNSVAVLREEAGANQDQATNMSCTIDGAAVSGLDNGLTTAYRVQAPVFTYTVPGSNNMLEYFGYDCYTSNAPIAIKADAVADGVYLMLAPLSVGPHTIHFHGEIGSPSTFTEDITYNLTVVPASTGIDPTNTVVDGKDYSQWSAAWWQWAMSLPVVGPVPHPFTDDPAFDVSEGQTGSVWFLGAPLDTAVRTCNIPEGKSLFVGLLNAEDSGLEDPGSTAADQLASAQFQADHIHDVSFSLDGVALANIGSYRVQSPQFTFTAPTPWLFGTNGGTSTSVSDGYFVMLDPLPPGTHTIHFSGNFHFATNEGDPFDYDADLDMTYHLTVVPASVVYPPGAEVYGQNYSEWEAAWWVWGMSLPLAHNPFNDDPPFDVTEGQTGPVWFLASTVDTNTRSCSIPDGKALFVGLLNAEDSELEDPGSTANSQRDTAQFLADHISDVTFSVDGATLTNVGDYRVQSPQFSFTAPTPWIFGSTGGADTSVGDGYFVMLPPLPPGAHILHATGAFHFAVADGDPFDYDAAMDMTYQLTVTGPSLRLALAGNNFVVSWPQTGSSYVLESTPKLDDATWSPVTGTVDSSFGNYQVTVPVAGASQFFRLRKQ